MKRGDLCVGDKELTDNKSEEFLLSVHRLEAEAGLVRFGGCLGELAEPTEGSSEAVLGPCARGNGLLRRGCKSIHEGC
jgi:hypothetical protein